MGREAIVIHRGERNQKSPAQLRKRPETFLDFVACDAFSLEFAATDLGSAENLRHGCRLYAHDFVHAVVGIGGFAEYLWFGEIDLGSEATDTSEARFAHLARAGFSDAEAVRLVVVLTTLCLGRAHGVIQCKDESSQLRPRQRQLKSWLEEGNCEQYPNLFRISELGLGTYGSAQLEFSITMAIDGAEKLLTRE